MVKVTSFESIHQVVIRRLFSVSDESKLLLPAPSNPSSNSSERFACEQTDLRQEFSCLYFALRTLS